MSFFHPDVIYIDATLAGPGWTFNYDGLYGVFSAFMPGWGTGLSYPTRILGSKENGALVFFTDTPQLFGGDLRILGSISFKDNLIIRWIDVWDWRPFDNLYGFGRGVTTDLYPSLAATTPASPGITALVNSLVAAFSSGSHAAAESLFHNDAVLEDMALRVEVQGSINIGRYFSRTIAKLAYGTGSSLRITRGIDIGGGYEFIGSASSGVPYGHIAIVADEGKIVRFTANYDASKYSAADLKFLVLNGVAPAIPA